MKKADFKKTLVRNTVQSAKPLSMPQNLPKKEIKTDSKNGKRNVQIDGCRIDKPELQSTLKLSKAIDNITKQKINKNITDNEKLAVDEKVTRKVNFPYEQHIYKDLIPLETDHCKGTQIITSRGPLPQKDKEPVLSDFLETKPNPKYFCLPQINIEVRANTVTTNNLKLYHITEKHEGFIK